MQNFNGTLCGTFCFFGGFGQLFVFNNFFLFKLNSLLLFFKQIVDIDTDAFGWVLKIASNSIAILYDFSNRNCWLFILYGKTRLKLLNQINS